MIGHSAGRHVSRRRLIEREIGSASQGSAFLAQLAQWARHGWRSVGTVNWGRMARIGAFLGVFNVFQGWHGASYVEIVETNVNGI
jgi:hypothetical protein